MSDAARIAQLEEENAQLRKALADLAESHRAHAERERVERERKEARSRVNRQNYERRKGIKPIQTSDSDRIQTLNHPSPPLDGSPLPSVPSFPSPLSSPHPTFPTASAIGGEVETLPDATDDAVPLDSEPRREALVLTAQTAGRKEPKPSEAQKLYAALEASRECRCEKVGQKFVAQGWDARRINATLGSVVKVRKGEAVNAEGKTEAQQRFEDAWNEYLADDDGATREPPWAIGWFMSGGVRARYETRAIRAQQGAA